MQKHKSKHHILKPMHDMLEKQISNFKKIKVFLDRNNFVSQPNKKSNKKHSFSCTAISRSTV